jgi:leucyl/phenylalanyl-tRNA---protein transferase
MIWIADHQPLPPAHLALGNGSDAPGLLAVGGSLSTTRLEEAYRGGIFPWYSEGQPVLWWSPDPRMVLPVDQFRLSHSLRKTLRRFLRTPGCELRFDSNFDAVIDACAQTPRNGQAGTWIVPEMIEAYREWHRKGAAHSVETWIDGQLAGGLYGIAIGRMFFGESMFSHRTDASKVALAALVAHCRHEGIGLIDCQQETGHLASFGARPIAREQFLQEVKRRSAEPSAPEWTYDLRSWRTLDPGLDPGLDTGPNPGAGDDAARRT